MRLRFWISLAAVTTIAVGSAIVAVVVHDHDRAAFDKMQRDEAIRAAHQTEGLARLSVGGLSSAAAFLQASGGLSRHEFGVISRTLLSQGALTATAFVRRVPESERARFESKGFRIFEGLPFSLRRAKPRPVHFPLTYVSSQGHARPAIGYDIAADSTRLPYLLRARDRGVPTATPVIPLLLGGVGVNVYEPVFRDGAPLATTAQRRRALVGFTAGSFKLGDLVKVAEDALPGDVEVQLWDEGKPVSGPPGKLADPARAPIRIADRTWLLVVRDPNRPELALPLLLAGIGIALAALLGSFILTWSRGERMRELERQASQDSLTGLHNRRRFEEDLRAAIARARRAATTGALLILDLDDFKQVNDTHGHPAGDRLIEEVAAVLRQRTRASDSLCRLGGDEFAVILPHCNRPEAVAAAESLAGAIQDHQPDSGVQPVTASVGVAMFGEGLPAMPASVVSEADAAMYAAKEHGRNGVRVFDHAALRDGA